MIAVTSLSFNRIERQQYCVQTWRHRGLKVIAVQAPGETEYLQQFFPDVTFKEYDLPDTNIFSKNTPTIYSMCQQAIEENDRIFLINSDISAKDKPSVFHQKLTHQENTLLVGIRKDADPGSKIRKLQKWGIDAFCLTPEMATVTPDLGFRVGLPGWDFWITYHLHNLGYITKVSGLLLFHENHPRGWNAQDHAVYRAMIAEKYQISKRFLPYFILNVTGRR